MEKEFGYYIVVGLMIGAIFGMGMGAASGNTVWGIGLGALGGLFLGWFIAVAALGKRDFR